MEDYYKHRTHSNVYQPKMKINVHAEDRNYGFDVITEINNTFYKQVVKLQDGCIRKNLIKLGWRPPEDG